MVTRPNPTVQRTRREAAFHFASVVPARVCVRRQGNAIIAHFLKEKTMRYRVIAPIAFAIVMASLFGGASVAQAADESVMLISRLYAAPGREAELETRVLKSVEFVRKIEPTTVIRAYRSKKDPSVFVFYEVFSSQAAYDEHQNVTNPARVKEMGPTPDGLFSRSPEIEAFTTLRN